MHLLGEIERIRTGGVEDAGASVSETVLSGAPVAKTGAGSRLHIQRVFQPSDEYVSVQGVRNGATCVINLPVSHGAVPALSEIFPKVGKIR